MNLNTFKNSKDLLGSCISASVHCLCSIGVKSQPHVDVSFIIGLVFAAGFPKAFSSSRIGMASLTNLSIPFTTLIWPSNFWIKQSHQYSIFRMHCKHYMSEIGPNRTLLWINPFFRVPTWSRGIVNSRQKDWFFLLVTEEHRRIVQFRPIFNPASEHSLDNFWSSDNFSNRCLYSCNKFPCRSSLTCTSARKGCVWILVCPVDLVQQFTRSFLTKCPPLLRKYWADWRRWTSGGATQFFFWDKNIEMTTGHEKVEDKQGKQRPPWHRRVIKSLGDGGHVVPMERRVAVLRREWMVSHVSQNSEHHVGVVAQLRRERMVAHDLAHKHHPRVVLWMKCVARTYFAWATCWSNQQNPGAATFRDGGFDRWDADQGISAGWKMHHASSLSRIAESQAVWEIHGRRPNCPERIQVPTVVGGQLRRQDTVSGTEGNSTFSVLPLKCNDVFPPPLLLNSPLSKALAQRSIGWPDPAKLSSIFSAVRSQDPSGLQS